MKKRLPKILIYFFLAMFIIQMASLLALMLLPQPAQADPVQFQPQVSIGKDFEAGKSYDVSGSTNAIGKYIQAIYNYSIGIVGILATVVLMFGGVLWIVAGGNAERVGNAKAWIGAALSGLVLALCSYVILNTVNPDLVNFQIKTIAEVKPFGCCEKPKNGSTCAITTQDNCESGWEGRGYSCKDGKCENDIAPKGCCLYKSKNNDWYIGCENNIKSEDACEQIATSMLSSQGIPETNVVSEYKVGEKCYDIKHGEKGCQ